MSPWDGLNRRRFPRVKYPCQVIVRNEQQNKEVILAHTENIGVGGVCAILKKGLPMFALVEVELDLLDFEDHVKCQGKVVWSVRRKSSEENKPMFYDIGIEFMDISDQDRARVETTVERLVKQGRLLLES